jgi:hypothetical protein
VIRLTTPTSRKQFHLPQRASRGRRSTEDDRVYHMLVFVLLGTCDYDGMAHRY